MNFSYSSRRIAGKPHNERSQETAKDRKIQLNSVDILARSEPYHLLLVHCTIGLPKTQDDVTRIIEIKRRLERELFEEKNVQILPVIFSTYGDLSLVKKEAEEHGVLVIDSQTSEKILTLLRDGKKDQALRILFQSLK